MSLKDQIQSRFNSYIDREILSGKTQTQVAKELEIKQSYLSRVLKGDVSVDKLIALLEQVGIDINLE